MAPKAAVPFLVAMMLFTGACNTLLSKYQDNQCVRNCSDPDPKNRVNFEQPVIQTVQMFVGESACWLVVAGLSLWRRWRRRGGAVAAAGYTALVTADDHDHDHDHDHEQDRHEEGGKAGGAGVLRGWGVLLLGLPAVCDIVGTTLMNAGLLLVAASIYQMTRGALVLFVGLFSVVFLHRRLHAFQWVSLVGVVLGVAVVGLAGAIWPDKKVVLGEGEEQHGLAASPAEALRVVAGVLMIAGAQVFTATQFVLEEWILEKSSVEPIMVVGWEGVFGLATTVLGMIVLHLTIGGTEAGRYGPFDIVEGWRQMMQNRTVAVCSVLIMLSIGGFNFFGLSVTRSVSATSRSTIDTCRTLFIWVVSLGLGWETFKWLQVVGFGLLVYFTFLFNGIVRPPLAALRPADDESVEELLPEEPVEHN